MIFVDANVIMYAVGQPHPLQELALDFFAEAERTGEPLCTSAEVLQELAHVYLSSGRTRSFDSAIALVDEAIGEVWSLEAEDVTEARQLYEQYPNLQARDLCHLASCQRRGVREIKTYDRAFAAIAL